MLIITISFGTTVTGTVVDSDELNVHETGESTTISSGDGDEWRHRGLWRAVAMPARVF